MSNLSHRRPGCAARLPYVRLIIGCAILSLVGSTTALADLIVQSVQYDGHVRSGAVVGVEEHFQGTDFSAPAFNIPLPATNPPLPAPLASANNLQITSVDHLNSAPLGGDVFPRLTIWIQNPNPADFFEVFDNTLDTTLPFPVQLEMFLYLEGLGATEQLEIFPRYETTSTLPPFPQFPSVMTSGRGSLADPLHLQLGLPASAVSGVFTNGALKVHLYYDRDDNLVPEPATLVLALLTLGPLAAAWRRKRS
jgi:hypothetical protein